MVYDRYFDEDFEDNSWGLTKVLRSSIKFCFEHAFEHEYDNIPSVMPRYGYYRIASYNDIEEKGEAFNATETDEPKCLDTSALNTIKANNPALDKLITALELVPTTQNSSKNSFISTSQECPF